MNKAILEHYKKDLLFGKWGTVGQPFPAPVGERSSLRMKHMWWKFVDRTFTAPEDKVVMPDSSTIDQFTEVISGADGNTITIFVATPKVSEAVPGILHMHGGGMCIFSANDPMYRAWRIHLALRGFVVASVEFRNSSGKLGCHPYPAGLNDCMSALKWLSAKRQQFGISKLVLSGESGGGNLCIASALRAKREGRLAEFDGVFALCPFIDGPSTWRAKSNTSWRECDGYFLDAKGCTLTASMYDPELKHAGDPCAWPGFATDVDLDGLPPHVISVNELDPLRDEGLAHCEKMKAAGVRAESRIVRGTPHAGEMLCLGFEGGHCILEETIDAMWSFAQSLGHCPA
jgi:acetyl esterase/lipase